MQDGSAKFPDMTRLEASVERLIAVGEQGNTDRISGNDTLGRRIRDSSGQQF
jgi:hypothetical protein